MTTRSSLWTILIGLTFSLSPLAASGSGQQDPSGKFPIHVSSSQSLHQAAVARSQEAQQARSDVARILDNPEVRTQVQQLGLQPDRLQQKVAALGDDEVLQLQSQLMPLAEQLETAAQDDGNRKKVLLWVLVAVVAALTIAMFMFYS